MVTLTVSAAKEQFLSLIRNTRDLGASYTITHNGKPYAVLMSKEEYEGLIETLEIMKDKNLTKELLRGAKEADQGKTLSHSQATGRKRAQ